MSGNYTDSQGVVYTYSGSTASVTGFNGGAIGVVIPISITVSDITYTVTSIGDNAFDSKPLTSVSIPASVQSIGDRAFYLCSSLASVTFLSPTAIPTMTDPFGSDAGIPRKQGAASYLNTVAYGIDQLTTYFLSVYVLLPTYTLNDVVYTLNYENNTASVTGCSGLEGSSVVITESFVYAGLTFTVTSIGTAAFDSTPLTSITIPASVQSIGSYVFSSCTSLASVTFEQESQLESIGGSAFAFTVFTSINIPASVTIIGENAFDYCSSLASVTFLSPTAIPTMSNPFGDGDDGPKKQGTAYYLQGATNTDQLSNYFNHVYSTTYTLNDVVYTLNYDNNTASVTGYSGTSESSVAIPESFVYENLTFTVTSIGNQAFDNASLTSITIPASVQSIGNYAFLNCFNLSSIIIPNTVLNLGSGMFHACTMLESAIIGNGLTILTSGTFDYCPKLKTVTFAKDSKIHTIGHHAFYSCLILSNLTIPPSVTDISYSAFNNLPYNVLITFEGNQIPSIASDVFGNYGQKQGTAFYNEGTPNYITLYNYFNHVYSTTYTLDDLIFTITIDSYSNTASVTGRTPSLGSSAVIPESFVYADLTFTVTSIGDNAFQGTALTSVSIPASVITIGDNAFSFCGSLASVTFGAGSQLQSIGLGAFQFTGLLSISIPANVTSIGGYTFYGCGSLASVTFEAGSQLQSILDGAFKYTPLTSITIPASVTIIGIYAFEGTPSDIIVNFLSESTIPTMTDPFGDDPTNPGQPRKQGTAYYLNTVTTGIDQLYEYFTNIVLTCFLEGTKILTKEGYKKIEELKKGDLVKTLSSGYKRIDMIGYKNMWNPASDERIKNQLYVYKKKNMEEVFEDLVLTGCHSVLIDRFETSEKREKVRSLLGGIFITEEKARLPACLDERAEIYKSEGFHTIYHVALENEVYTNSYGIYANGLLVESCSQEYLKELSGMMLKE